MKEIRLGKTEIITPQNGFGALPVQRVGTDEAVKIIRRAYEGGMTFFDTARFYTDSEEKLGIALEDVRKDVYIASKAMTVDSEELKRQLDATLTKLRTDHLDIYQFHNPPFCPKPGDGTMLYETMLDMKDQGMIRHIGITNHRYKVAEEAIESGLYETLQFPFSYLAGEPEHKLVDMSRKADMGFIAMKGLSGGLITNSAAAYAYIAGFDNIVPIWGVQRMSEIEEFLAFFKEEPVLDSQMEELIKHDREELAGEFCRGCGYCMPCPAGIEISACARMSLMIRRAPQAAQMTEEMQAKMAKINDCLHCGQCSSRCPYGLDTPSLLERNLKDYTEIINGKQI